MIRPLLPNAPSTSATLDELSDADDEALSWSSFGNDVFGGTEVAQRCRLPRRRISSPRSDEQIERDLYERLREDPKLDAHNITIFACNGTVMIAGQVPARGMRDFIEDTAGRCRGVRRVLNRLRVA